MEGWRCVWQAGFVLFKRTPVQPLPVGSLPNARCWGATGRPKAHTRDIPKAWPLGGFQQEMVRRLLVGWAVVAHRVCVFLSCLCAGFGYGPPPPPPDQFAPPGVPPPPATPGAAPLAFPPPPSQAAPDMSKPPTAQPDFPYSQYGELETCRRGLGPGTWPHLLLPSSPPAGVWREARCAGACCGGSSKTKSRILVFRVLGFRFWLGS